MEDDTLSGRFTGFFAYTKSTAATNQNIAVQITRLIGQISSLFHDFCLTIPARALDFLLFRRSG